MIIERYPKAVAAIVEGGHELAHHGYTHQSPAEMAPDDELEAIRRASGLIREACGKQPLGYRSPS